MLLTNPSPSGPINKSGMYKSYKCVILQFYILNRAKNLNTLMLVQQVSVSLPKQ